MNKKDTIMNEQEYFQRRVDDQISWYDRKSGWHKRWFMRMKITETILALMIPLLTGYITTEGTGLKVLVGVLGLLVAISASIITLAKLQENWIEYRTVAETLKHEKFLFITKSGPYREEGAFPLFVERFEGFISKENSQWAAYNRSSDGESKTHGG